MGKGIKNALENPFFGRVETPKFDELRSTFDTEDKEELTQLALARMERNVRTTGHPLHHLAATGVAVDRDPTLEKAIARLSAGVEVVPCKEDYYEQHPGVLLKLMGIGEDETTNTVD